MFGKKKNVAGMMGAISSQPIEGMRFAMNVDPLERMEQRRKGRLMGVDPKKTKRKKSLMGMYNGR